MKLRYARSAARTLGAREKRARDKAEEEANKVRLIECLVIIGYETDSSSIEEINSLSLSTFTCIRNRVSLVH